jgi:hypothetical protein
MTEDPRSDRPDRPGRRRPARSSAARPGEEPVLPDVSRDETDVGWGDEPGERSDDWYRRERPPHHE